MLTFSLDPKEIGLNPLLCLTIERQKEVDKKKSDVLKSLEGLTMSEALYLLSSIRLGDLMNCYVLDENKVNPFLERFYHQDFSNKEA